LLTSQVLKRIKTKALRQKVWFKALTRIERSVIDLTIRCVRKVQSSTLAKAILAVLNKLWSFLREGYLNQAEKIGRKIAGKICETAMKWGNLQAWIWKYDLDFIRFLGVSTLNI